MTIKQSEMRPAESGLIRAFTLVELLVVIAVIGIIAGFIFPVAKSVKRWQYLKTASAELNHLQTALENYKAQYGAYPPSNQNPNSNYAPLNDRSQFNQLYYELSGTSQIDTGSVKYFQTLDGSSMITNSPANDVLKAYGVAGFINCGSKTGDENTPAAKNFLPGLSSRQISGSVSNHTVNTIMLITTVGGPDASYQPVGVQGVNPFRYVYPGVNNPSGYDLWVQLVINGQTNLVCNWSRQVQINNALP